MSDYSSQRYRSSAIFDDENTEEMAIFDEQFARRTNSKSSTDPYDMLQARNVLVDISALCKGVTAIYKKFDKSKLSILREKLTCLRINQDGIYDRYLNMSTLFGSKDFTIGELNLIKEILLLVGFTSSDTELFYHNNPKEIFKRVLHAEKTLSLYEYYLEPINIGSMKHKLPFCIHNEELDFGIQTIVKVSPSEDPEALNHLDIDGDGGLSFQTEKYKIRGKFDSVILSDVDLQTENLVRNSIRELMGGKNIIYALSGQTSSGKTSTLLGTGNRKLDNLKPEKGLANQIFDILSEELPENYTISLVCQQIFNEMVFDLLKKKDKETISCETERTNFEWLRISHDIHTIAQAQNKDTFQKTLKRIAKNRALLSLNGKFIERRSSLVFRFVVTKVEGTQAYSSEFVIVKLPSSEKLTSNEIEELKGMNMNNQIYNTFTDIRNLLISGSLSTNPGAFFRLFHSKFLTSSHFTIISHIKLNKESEQETKLQMNFLRNFNPNIEVTSTSDHLLVDTEFIGDILSRFEDLEKLTQDESTKYRITQLNSLELGISKSLKDLEKFNPGLTPFEFLEFNHRLSDQTDRMQVILKSLEIKRKELHIGSRTLDTKNQNSNSGVSHTNSSNSRNTLTSVENPKPSSAGNSETNSKGNPFSKLIFKFFENDINNTKGSLAGEGRCPVCTLCIPCKHYDTLQKLTTETKSNCSNTRRQTPLARSVYDKNSHRDKDAENLEPFKPNSVPHTNRRTVETKEPVSKSNIDSCPASETNRQLNPNPTPSFKIRTRRGNPLGELRNISNHNTSSDHKESTKPTQPAEEKPNILVNIKCEKLLNQLRLEEYQEKRVLDAINGMDENKYLEELLKKENEKQDQKRQRYYSEQRKRLDELKKKKEAEVQAELQSSSMIIQKEKQKKKEMARYYASLKKRVTEYKEKKKANDLSLLLEEKQEENITNRSEDRKLFNALFLEKVYMPKATPLKPSLANGVNSNNGSAVKNYAES